MNHGQSGTIKGKELGNENTAEWKKYFLQVGGKSTGLGIGKPFSGGYFLQVRGRGVPFAGGNILQVRRQGNTFSRWVG